MPTRNSKSRSTPSAKNPIVLDESIDDPNPNPTLGDIYPVEPNPEPKINPSLLLSNVGSFKRLSEILKVAPAQSDLSPTGILASRSFKHPELIEDVLLDFKKSGVSFKEPHTTFLDSSDPVNGQLTLYI